MLRFKISQPRCHTRDGTIQQDLNSESISKELGRQLENQRLYDFYAKQDWMEFVVYFLCTKNFADPFQDDMILAQQELTFNALKFYQTQKIGLVILKKISFIKKRYLVYQLIN